MIDDEPGGNITLGISSILIVKASEVYLNHRTRLSIHLPDQLIPAEDRSALARRTLLIFAEHDPFV